MHRPEELILSEIRKSDQGALIELYRAHYAMVLHLILSNSGSEQEAKDIYQEAVIALYEKLQQRDFSLTCKIKTYLYAVSRRLWLKRLWEKKKFDRKIDELETFGGIEDEMEEMERNEIKFSAMQHSLGGLGEPCRTLIEDFYIRDLSMDSIAEKFGYTNTDNAKNQKYKCLQRLKKIFFSRYTP